MKSFLTCVHYVVHVPATTDLKDRDKYEYSVLGRIDVCSMITWDSRFGHHISPSG